VVAVHRLPQFSSARPTQMLSQGRAQQNESSAQTVASQDESSQPVKP
jgi:hypothetical protein